jgi:hypothetical protein
MPVTTAGAALSEAGFLSAAREGARRYHDEHPFPPPHARRHAHTRRSQRWVEPLLRQTRIPIKDALILSKSDDPGFAGCGSLRASTIMMAPTATTGPVCAGGARATRSA